MLTNKILVPVGFSEQSLAALKQACLIAKIKKSEVIILSVIEEQSKISGYSVQEIEKGLWPAVEEFLKSSSEWILEKRYTNCNGLTILRKVDIESSTFT